MLSPAPGRVLAIVIAVAAAPLLVAHGGSYRAPGNPFGGSGTPSGPNASSPGSTGNTGNPDTRRWEVWWSFNQEEFFPRRGTPTPILSGDGYAGPGPRTPTAGLMRAEVVPLLKDLLKNGSSVHLRDAAAIALGRIGTAEDLAALDLALKDRERSVIEASILSLGLLRLADAETRLIALAKDATRSARERGFAVLALGYSGGTLAKGILEGDLGAATSPLGDRSRAADLEALRAFSAALASRGDLAPPGRPPEMTTVTGHLLRAIALDRSPEQEFLPMAYTALSKVRDPVAQSQVLAGLEHRKSDVRAGAAIAAGRVFREPDVKTARRLVAALDRESDHFVRHLLLISLGRIGGPTTTAAVMGRLDDNDRQERAFAALALGVGGVTEAAPRLRAELAASRDASLTGALAIALGLLRDAPGQKSVLALLEDRKNPELQAHLADALLLFGDQSAGPALRRVLVDSKVATVQAPVALALGLLSPDESGDLLVSILRESGAITVKAAAAAALGRTGDARRVETLIAFVKNQHEQPLARAFGIVALGILGEPATLLPAFARCSIDAQYGLRIPVLDEVRSLL